MKIIEKISEMQKLSNTWRTQGKKIGFIPTMGYLHEGHLSLIRAAAEKSDIVVMSIFVNPTQFGPGEDYETYPRDYESDFKLAEENGVNVVFYPDVEEMYPQKQLTKVNISEKTDILCGKDRPGHFQGVTTVVTKLFNIVKPHVAVFGQKDAQQVAVIQTMVRDLNMDINIIITPIVREKDGLAMSSRNVRLTEDQRRNAVILSQTLFWIREKIESGQTNYYDILNEGRRRIGNHGADTDYLEILTYPELLKPDGKTERKLVAVAARFGNVRLIDNVIIGGIESRD